MKSEILFAGICVATFAASGLFFFKFWRAARDPFFFLFGLACLFLSIERLGLVYIEGAQSSIQTAETEAASWIYLFRLAAYIFIILAIVQKNRRSLLK